MPRLSTSLAVAVAALGAAAPAAHAAVTATYSAPSDNSNGGVTATGDNADDTITVGTPTATSISITAAGINDPDGNGTACSVANGTATCTAASYAVLDGGGGNDTLTDARTFPSDLQMDGGDGNDTFNGSRFANDFSEEPGADTYHGGNAPTDPADPAYKDYLSDGGDPADYQLNTAADSYDAYMQTAPLNVSLDDQANDGTAGEGDNVGSDVEVIYGGPGADTLTAGAASAYIGGGAGDDHITGGAGNDRLFGGGAGGSDVVLGNAGDDTIGDDDEAPAFPQPGDPAPVPPGPDQLSGGPGDDTIYDGAGADDVSGGDGNDTVDLSRTMPHAPNTPSVPYGFTVSLDDQPNDGATGTGEGDNVHTDVENVDTGDGDDVISGSAAANDIDTEGGNDTVDPGPGLDTVELGSGNDSVSSVDGQADLVDGGAGTDTANVDLPGDDPAQADVALRFEAITGTPLPRRFLQSEIPVDLPPAVSLSGLKLKSKTFLKRGIVSVKVTVNEPAKLSGQLTVPGRLRAVDQLVIGTGKLGLAGGTRTLKLKVGAKDLRSYRRRLRTKKEKRKGLSIALSVVATDAGGKVTTRTGKVKIKG